MDLESINDKEIYTLTCTEEAAIDFAQTIGLLPTFKVCCDTILYVKQRLHGRNKSFVFRCTKKNCRKEYSLRKESFFEKSKLSVEQIILLMYFFVKGETSLESLKRKVKILDDGTLVDWLSFLREVCTAHFERHPIRIGGPGINVEIDEVHLVKRKYNVGQLVREQWCFGGVEVNTKQGFIFAVPDRRRNTLWPIIQNHILVGSIITADLAKVYDGLDTLGYRLFRVNHKINFVNPVSGATTNHIESMWQKVKHVHKNQYGTARTTLQAHLGEFMWRQRYKDSLFYFVEHVKELYNIN